MRPFIVFLLTGILSFVAGLFFPWWSLAAVAFVVALIFKQNSFVAFITAFLAIFLFWFGYAYFIDLSNDHILANRMSQLFLSTKSPVLLCVISAGIGGIVAGFAALSAALLRNKKKEKVHKDRPFNYSAG